MNGPKARHSVAGQAQPSRNQPSKNQPSKNQPSKAQASRANAQVLQCLADPTRRAIIEQLRKAPASVGEVADRLPVSRPAVSQHLKVLEGAGLVRHERSGTQRIFRVDVAGLAHVRRYLDELWSDALRALEQDQSSDRTKK